MDHREIDLKWENMLAGIKAQVPFLRQSPAAIYADIKERLHFSAAPSRVYLTGCGDSWYCGMATRFAFEAWAGVPTEAVQALEFSRYLVNYAPPDGLVIAVSNSGLVSRTIEAVIQGNRGGLYTIACTGNLKEGLSQEADATIDLAYAERRFAPGTSSYMASMVVQYCLALYLAEVRQRMSPVEVQTMLRQVSSIAEGVTRTISDNNALYEELGKAITQDALVLFIGGGPNYGTASFSMAKMIEAARLNAIGQELEEWAHEQYFITDEDTYTFVIAPPGASRDRAREQMYAIREMGSTCIALCDPDDEQTKSLADLVIPVFGQPDELLSPLVYCVPAEMIAFHVATSGGLKMMGFDDDHVRQVNFKQIFHSNIKRD